MDSMENQEKTINEKPAKSKYKKVRCDICGSVLWNTNMYVHLKSKKHNDFKYVCYERFEIIQ